MLRMVQKRALIGTASLLVGCGGVENRELGVELSGEGTASNGQNTTSDPDGSGAAGDDDAMTSGSGSQSATATMGGGSASSGEEDVKFDVAAMPDFNMVEQGCTKVDFLFVIDNSGTMNNEQSNLINSFPGFIDGIQSTLEEVDDYQVGVVTTDAYSYNSNGCNQLGELVVSTGGAYSSNDDCGPYAAGANFMTEADDLATTFACAAQVGTSGASIERPMDAMVNVVSKIHGGPGDCNEGYLRDDALLVIVLITDEWDGPEDPEPDSSSGTPQEWYDAVVAAKLGIAENAVALGLINWDDPGGGPVPCSPSTPPYDGVHIREFVSLFGVNGFLGGVCEPDYGPVFASAVAVIEDACNNFTPPG